MDEFNIRLAILGESVEYTEWRRIEPTKVELCILEESKETGAEAIFKDGRELKKKNPK